MDRENEIKDILREVSEVISKSLSEPETMAKLEKLSRKGFQLYLVMEGAGDDSMAGGANPIMPIQVGAAPTRSEQRSDEFELSDEDKDFLRTLKIRID